MTLRSFIFCIFLVSYSQAVFSQIVGTFEGGLFRDQGLHLHQNNAGQVFLGATQEVPVFDSLLGETFTHAYTISRISPTGLNQIILDTLTSGFGFIPFMDSSLIISGTKYFSTPDSTVAQHFVISFDRTTSTIDTLHREGGQGNEPFIGSLNMLTIDSQLIILTNLQDSRDNPATYGAAVLYADLNQSTDTVLLDFPSVGFNIWSGDYNLITSESIITGHQLNANGTCCTDSIYISLFDEDGGLVRTKIITQNLGLFRSRSRPVARYSDENILLFRTSQSNVIDGVLVPFPREELFCFNNDLSELKWKFSVNIDSLDEILIEGMTVDQDRNRVIGYGRVGYGRHEFPQIGKFYGYLVSVDLTTGEEQWRRFIDPRPTDSIEIAGETVVNPYFLERINDLVVDDDGSLWITGYQMTPKEDAFLMPPNLSNQSTWWAQIDVNGCFRGNCPDQPPYRLKVHEDVVSPNFEIPKPHKGFEVYPTLISDSYTVQFDPESWLSLATEDPNIYRHNSIGQLVCNHTLEGSTSTVQCDHGTSGISILTVGSVSQKVIFE